MNIDDLKGAWGQDKPTGMQIPDSAALKGKTTSAIGTIRKNMKTEFISTLVAYALLVAYIAFIQRELNGLLMSTFFVNTISLLLLIMLFINGYCFGKFYLFYRSISRYDLGMAASIRKITYELELNMEIYKTYSICMMPISVLITFTLVGGNGLHFYTWLREVLSSSSLFSGRMLWLFLTVISGFAITWFFVSLHVRRQYGRYAAELKQVMNDLNE
jgi:hypothetical protein